MIHLQGTIDLLGDLCALSLYRPPSFLYSTLPTEYILRTICNNTHTKYMRQFKWERAPACICMQVNYKEKNRLIYIFVCFPVLSLDLYNSSIVHLFSIARCLVHFYFLLLAFSPRSSTIQPFALSLPLALPLDISSHQPTRPRRWLEHLAAALLGPRSLAPSRKIYYGWTDQHGTRILRALTRRLIYLSVISSWLKMKENNLLCQLPVPRKAFISQWFSSIAPGFVAFSLLLAPTFYFWWW